MILVYSHTITNRLIYAVDLIFKTVLNSQYQITEDEIFFRESNLPKLAYTNKNEGYQVFVSSASLLFESGFKPQYPVAEKKYVGFSKFFSSQSNDFLGYDIFSMVFYFATRYEEYMISELDYHERFKAENSLAYNYGCLQIPFLNTAIAEFGDKLMKIYPALNFSQRKYNFLSTIDIDNAFAFAHKGFKRNVGGFLKDACALKLSQMFRRIQANINDENDAYNTFKEINRLTQDSRTALHYFALIGDYSTYDKNPSFLKPGFRKLLKSLSVNYPMGLHPSYQSFQSIEKIELEVKRLEDVIEKKVTSARCHFLRIKFPETYRAFIEHGITDDYTMIYASQSGFRTGLCVPYQWFDLQKNEATHLTIHTSVIMEGTLRDYNKLSSENAKHTALTLMEEVKKYGGEFISIFHNDSFVAEQKEWIAMYIHLLQNSKF